MARKIITTKSQIPKYAQKKIPKFSELSDVEAIYRYEYIKLQRRARATFKKGYYIELKPVDIKEASEERIQQLRQMTVEKIRTSETREAYEERFRWSDEGYNDKQYELQVANDREEAEKLFQDITEFVKETATSVIMAYSTYKSGRSRTEMGMSFIKRNVNNAEQIVLAELESAKFNMLDTMYELMKDGGSKYYAIQNAITAFFWDSTTIYGGGDRDHPDFQAIVTLLSGNPVGLDQLYDDFEER